MATNSYEEVLKIVVRQEGDSELGKLAKSLLDAGKAGGAAEREIEGMAGALAKLSQQKAAADNFKRLQVELQKTTLTLTEAKSGVAALETQFDRTDQSSRKVVSAFAKADRQVSQLTEKQAALQKALNAASAGLVKAGVDANRLADEERRIAVESDAAARAVKRIGDQSAAASAKSVEGLGRLRTALAGLAAFVGLEKIKDGIVGVVDAGERIDDLQKQFATAFGGIEAGAVALQRVRDFAKTVPNSFEEVSAAAIRLRQLGFDPLDGTLQALIDNQQALDASQEGLIATIEALGKANVRGGVNMRALVSITEQGVPVFDLLGKAMGISADRVRQLANEGKLGTDSIKLLVTELGKLRAGAAADELGDFDAQMTKVKDSVREFFEQIAQSGALDVFRGELRDLNNEVAEAAKSGRLKELAKSVSDGIVGTANAIKTAVRFVYDYSGSLVELGKTYLLFRGLKIASKFLDDATAMLAAAKAAKTAAVEAGTATGTFGKLGVAIRSIPSGIKFAVSAVAVDFALTQVVALYNAINELEETSRRSQEVDKDRADTFTKLGERIAAAKNEYRQYADVAIASAEQLKQQGADQLRSYGDQLAGAQQYYRALVAEARVARDEVALAGAKEKLAEVETEIAAVNAQLAVTSAVGASAASGLTAGAAAMVAKLGDVKEDAKAAAEVIGQVFDGFDLKKPTQDVGDFAVAFDAVAAQGGKAAATLDATLLESLKKLSGADLLRFQTTATAAIDAVGGNAEKNSAVLRATLETALDRLGVKAEDTGAKITKSGADTIAMFNTVATNAQASAQTIAAAFDSALAGVKTKEEAEALGAALKIAAQTGRIGFGEMAAAGRELDERIRTITSNLSPLKSQFDVLGIRSQAQLNAVRDNAREAFGAIVEGAREGTAAQEDVVRAFKAYADAARAAVADSSEAQRQQVEDYLATQASVFGLSDALSKAGEAGKAAGNKTGTAFGDATDKIDDASEAANKLKDNAEGAADSVSAIGSAASSTSGNLAGARSELQSVVILTIEQQRLLRNAWELYERGSVGAEEYERRVRIAMTGVDDSLQKQEESLRRFQDAIDDVNSQIAQLSGDDTADESIRHERRLRDLKDEFDTGTTYTTEQYRQLVDAENKLHDLKLENLRKQQTENSTRPDAAAASNREATAGPGKGAGSVPAPSNFSVAVNVQGDVIGGSADTIAEKLARLVRPELQKIEARSR